MDYVINVVLKIVNFIDAIGLNHKKFDNLLEESYAYSLPYHTEVH